MTTPAPDYTRRERASVAVSAILGFWMDFYNLGVIAFLIAALQRSLALSLVEAGTIASVTLFGSVLGGILFGWVGDRLGRKASLLWTLGLYSFGAIASALSWNYASLLAFRFITGVGLGGEWGAGMVLLNEVWNHKRRGLGSSIVQSMAVAGVAAAAIVGTWTTTHLGDEWGWRVAFACGGSPILLMVYVRFWMPESRLWLDFVRLKKAGKLPAEKTTARGPFVEMLRHASGRYLVLGVIAWGAFVISNQSVSLFMPSLMIRALGASPDVVRNVALFNALWGGACMITLGWCSDRMGRKLGALGATVIAVASAAGIYLASGSHYPGTLWVWPMFWCYLLWSVGQSAAAMFGPWLSELFPVELRSTAVATIYTLGRTIGAAAPVIVPSLAAFFGGALVKGMMFGSVGSLVCLAAIAFLPETAGRQFNVVEGKDREDATRTRPWGRRREA